MLLPDQFQVNEAWIAFTLSEAPIRTEQDGAFNCVALMDAASCVILSSEFVPVGNPEPSKIEAERLLKAGQERARCFPATLFVPAGQFQVNLSAEAKRQSISVVTVHERQLQAFIGEARRSFQQHFGGR